MPIRVLASMLILSALAAAHSGCDWGAPKASKQAAEGRTAQRRADQANTLLRSVVSQVDRLSDSVQLELRPPTVLLDSRSSADGEDVLAIVRRRPGVLDEPPDLMVVPAGNARLKINEIEPGDQIKYFIELDRETRMRLAETGEADIVTMDSRNLYVAQVLDDNTILLAGGMPVEIPTPAKIEIWRNVDDRMEDISSQLGRYLNRRDPPLSWQPSGDEAVLNQITERLNQWLRQSKPSKSWSRPALLDTLDATLADAEELAPTLSEEALASGSFQPHESRLIQEATWLRDLGEWAPGGAIGPLEQGAAIFDWVVRNLRLVAPEDRAPHFLWEILMHGRATAEQRAWAFAAICRHQGLSAGVLLVPTGASDAAVRTLALLAADGEAYLFDPELGLPLSGEDPERPAKLSELLADDSLLRGLDLEETPYPLNSESLALARVGVVAEPFAVTLRAAELGSRLSGADALRLSVDPDTVGERLSAATGGLEPVLWALPYETLRDKLTIRQSGRQREVRRFLPLAWRPRLWKARTLHFRGRYEEADSRSSDALAETLDDHLAAMRLYMSPRVRPKREYLMSQVVSEEKKKIFLDSKATATLWLGVLSYEDENYQTAIRWLASPALQQGEGERLADAVRYNLARAYEANGQIAEAIELLEADDSPQRHGNRLRAQRLAALVDGADAETPEGSQP